ncbi:nicotinate (nicotinamide) nucleotide adenylyltransferase [Nonlabens agnitus]|uniref:Probable nicotinate-nucleotide adenylyltransferase n=1 Tax=Nonlabens agnitus TaxID=870484 RepID=A0A2S9WVP3_9FLAO|nr:nicotinate (nicotinamide) nucleotide adenylyltransferase [Nonlabens agnitus]PRP67557.1 nicotinic acid mononucleotide adenylyltransferase [Nonlabens agnitus]
MKKSKVGLYFGTFNPIHIGHLAIANYLVENSDLKEIWMVVTPHNPLKKKSTLLDDYQRLHMVHLAVDDYLKIKPSQIEFNLPQPNYTVNTLAHLKEKYPDTDFVLIMGEDNLKSLPKWKNYKVLLEDYSIIVYPRISPGEVPLDLIDHPSIQKIDAPIMEISSTMIRKGIASGQDLRYFLHQEVYTYITEMNFYK